MTKRIQEGGLQVAASLHDFITAEALPGTGVSAATFWSALDSIVHDLAPVNRSLLQKREDLQTQIDAWLRDRKGQALDAAAYRAFLVEIGYLLPEGADFSADTPETDPEIASIAGPQLVVPVMNARYALNAANARWGSLYDALYGTDAISEDDGATRSGGFNPARGAKVIAFARDILNRAVPLAAGVAWRCRRVFGCGWRAGCGAAGRQDHHAERCGRVCRLSWRPGRTGFGSVRA